VKQSSVSLYFVSRADGSYNINGFFATWYFSAPPEVLAPQISARLPAPSVSCDHAIHNFLQPTGGRSLVKNCGLNVSTARRENRISSFRREGFNSSEKFCLWHVSAAAGETVSLAFKFFNLNTTNGDKMIILNPITCDLVEGGFITGSLTPGKVITTNEPAIALYYYSPTSELIKAHSAGHGFILDASSHPSSILRPVPYPVNSCTSLISKYINLSGTSFFQNYGFDVVKNSGVILSPNYPNSYANNSRCVWNINAPGAHQIRIIVELDKLENFWDRLFILRPSGGCQPLVEDGDIFIETGGSFVTNSDSFSIYFFSDDTVSYGGFRIYWHVLY